MLPLLRVCNPDSMLPNSRSSETLPRNVRTSRRQWLAVFAVAVSAFAFVTCEFLPVGLLTHIALDLNVTSGTAGLMMTLPGVMAALSAPASVIVAGKWDRRHVFLILTGLLLCSSFVSAFSTNLTTMLTGRALLGMALGGFWTLATAAAGRMVQVQDTARAIAFILAGVTSATVIGVPLGTLIAEFVSWRYSFIATGVLATVALFAQVVFVPQLPSDTSLRVQDFISLLSRPHTRLSLVVVALVFGAHFSAYTFLEPRLEEDFSVSAISAQLLAFGIVGFISNATLSVVIESHLKVVAATVTTLLFFALLLMVVLDHTQIGETVALLLWGVAFGAIPLCFSVWTQRDAIDRPEVGSAIFICVVQVAIAIGAAMGGAIVDRVGIRADFFLGCTSSVLGLVILWKLTAPSYGQPESLPDADRTAIKKYTAAHRNSNCPPVTTQR
ncbi:MFS transporter [Burkholderia cenocepacia]|uniref:MFS transporter n=1 Tax=Burkholderia cenocepacia TaxID=95486 RepID=UPI0039F03C97